MKDRIPTKPGRVTLTPVPGQENTYDLVRADEPAQEGTPLNKAALLKDETAALYGLGTDAVPDDVLKLLAFSIPRPYGVLAIRTMDASGRYIGNTSVKVSPTVQSKQFLTMGEDGVFSGYADAGTYQLTFSNSSFYSADVETKEAVVVPGKITIVTFLISLAAHGIARITESVEMDVPAELTSPIDIFAVGGGASGIASRSSNASGAGSGYTQTLLNQDLSGKRLRVLVGAGGMAVVSDQSTAQTIMGKSGGSTLVYADGELLLSASGGNKSNGGSGGSGNGNSTGGSDGADGNVGTGQGRTTRAFGETDGELFSGAGGGGKAMGSYPNDESIRGLGGAGGGGAGAASEDWTSSGKTLRASSATHFGGGGGGAALSSNVGTAYSGAGYQGIVILRW